MDVLKLNHVSFAYGAQPIFEGIDYAFEDHKIYAIVGRSGEGKTTLLSVMSGLAEPSSGDITVNGNPIGGCDKYEYRSRDVGVIFQNFNLLTKLTAAENVAFSIELSEQNDRGGKKSSQDAISQKAYDLLSQMGLSRDEADRRVLKLSGGQQQRVAIARALSYGAGIILADEPTGNLDQATQMEIMELFRHLADEGKCVIIVTHSATIAEQADVCVDLAALKQAGAARGQEQ
ncbi:MAG: ABC transporter ATP-binding protein [Eubacteriaceae bacterium]|nr:ABC transporter ATP-binding protein [Eubacteriaceae bacterium]